MNNGERCLQLVLQFLLLLDGHLMLTSKTLEQQVKQNMFHTKCLTVNRAVVQYVHHFKSILPALRYLTLTNVTLRASLGTVEQPLKAILPCLEKLEVRSELPADWDNGFHVFLAARDEVYNLQMCVLLGNVKSVSLGCMPMLVLLQLTPLSHQTDGACVSADKMKTNFLHGIMHMSSLHMSSLNSLQLPINVLFRRSIPLPDFHVNLPELKKVMISFNYSPQGLECEDDEMICHPLEGMMRTVRCCKHVTELVFKFHLTTGSVDPETWYAPLREMMDNFLEDMQHPHAAINHLDMNLTLKAVVWRAGPPHKDREGNINCDQWNDVVWKKAIINKQQLDRV